MWFWLLKGEAQALLRHSYIKIARWRSFEKEQVNNLRITAILKQIFFQILQILICAPTSCARPWCHWFMLAHNIPLDGHRIFAVMLCTITAGTPRKIGWGCAAHFPKPLPYLWPKSAIFLPYLWPDQQLNEHYCMSNVCALKCKVFSSDNKVRLRFN